MITLHISADERVRAWLGFNDAIDRVVGIFGNIGIKINIGQIESVPRDAVDTSSGGAQTIYDGWKHISNLRKDVILTLDTFLLYIPYYETDDATAGREYRFANNYVELFTNANSPRRGVFQNEFFYLSEQQILLFIGLICHEIGHAFHAEHDMSTTPKTIMYGQMWQAASADELVFSSKSLEEMGAVGTPIKEDMMRRYVLPFDRQMVSMILNYVNHGETPDSTSGYIRDGVYCRTADGDDSKPTYWRGQYRHNAIDYMMPVGSPVYAPCDGYVIGASYSSSAGNVLEIRTDDLPDNRVYFMYMHLDEMLVGKDAKVVAGQLVAYSGSTGSLCGTPHLHLAIGTSSGSGNIDPLVDPRFQQYLSGLPYVVREGHMLPHFKPFVSNSPVLTINGAYETIAYNQQASTFQFDITGGDISKILHICKYVKSEWHDIEDYSLIHEMGTRGWVTLDGSRYVCIVLQDSDPGLYYFQAVTGSGQSSNPVRIWLRDSMVL